MIILKNMDRKQIEVNYLYFGAFLGLLLMTSGSGIFTKAGLGDSRSVFFLYAAGQALFETLALIFLGWIIRIYLGSTAAMAYIGGTFVFLIMHLIDFVLNRILDLSIWDTIEVFVFGESWSNFIYLLDASGVPIWIWMLAVGAFAALPFIGMAIHSWTNRIVCRRRPLFVRPEWLLQAFLCIPAALCFWEYSSSRLLHPDAYTSLLQSLPWKWTFLQPQAVQYPMSASLFHPGKEKDMRAAIDADPTVLSQKPNIYLFVIESFREDFIDPNAAPHLHRFKQEANHFDLGLSNANGSHLSWFSIFHSQFSYFWNHLQSKGWTMGSPPINLLKKWGYKIRVYSSAQLKYYGMDELLFGKDLHLIDSYQTFHHAPPATAADSDRQALAKWKKDLSDNPDLAQGQCVIVFWDSTHFNYSWPQDWKLKFTPISKECDYFNVIQSPKKIEKIKNRYRNSVNYVDSLFGDFLKDLPDKENAIVIVTGDHGEEFLEHGHLFHGSHLTHEQTNIPLYMKFGQRIESETPRVVSQMDIFPSLLHHLSGRQIAFLEGRSIFSQGHWPYAIIARFNAGCSPYEFCVHNGDHKLIARFDNKKDMFRSAGLKIRSLWNKQDQCPFSDCNHHNMKEWVQMEFGPAIERVFSRFPNDPSERIPE
jgi:hypothetical protein